MKFSDKTLNLLKNFSNINQSILFQKGSILRTVSNTRNIFAEASLSEDFPVEFGVYDLPSFLNNLNMFDNPPEMSFQNNSVVMTGDGPRTQFYFSDTSTLFTPKHLAYIRSSEKPTSNSVDDLSFKMPSKFLEQLLKSSSINQLPDFSVVSQNKKIALVVRDKLNNTSTASDLEVGKTDKEFNLNFKVEYMKLLPGNYDVTISHLENQGQFHYIGVFKNTTCDVTYWIALESDSSFD